MNKNLKSLFIKISVNVLLEHFAGSTFIANIVIISSRALSAFVKAVKSKY